MTAPKVRSSWRDTDLPRLASLDIIGLRHFIYGGDPEWVRRRYWMVLSLGIGLLTSIAACAANAVGFLSDTLAKTVVDGFFTQVTVMGPGYVLGGVWDKKNQMTSGASIEEETTVVTDAGPPEQKTETTTKTITPPAVAAPVPEPDK